jgi:hypothetical protein
MSMLWIALSTFYDESLPSTHCLVWSHNKQVRSSLPFYSHAFLQHPPQKSANLIFFGVSAEPWLTSDVSPLLSLT